MFAQDAKTNMKIGLSLAKTRGIAVYVSISHYLTRH